LHEQPLLHVDNLTVDLPSPNGRRHRVLRGVDLTLSRGESVGLVGESGCGKSLTALAILGLLPAEARVSAGHVVLRGNDLLELPEAAMRRVRGGEIGLVFQEPMTALNPVLSIGYQIIEAVRLHRRVHRRSARQRASELLRQVAIPDPVGTMDAYPHQLSGGQRQRVLLAMALAAEPAILIADEPTTALDVTIQAQILDLLDELAETLQLTILLITHDLGLVAGHCDRALVMYAGRVVEEASVLELFDHPAHPYTRALLRVAPRLGQQAARGKLPSIPGAVPDAARLPSGCAFHPRCPDAMARCEQEDPPAYDLGGRQRARCFLWSDRATEESHPGE